MEEKGEVGMGVDFLALRDWLACLWEFAVLNC